MKKTPSLFYRVLTGILLTAITTILYLWFKDIELFNIKVINSILLVTIAHTLAAASVDKLFSFPGKQTWFHFLPAVGIAYSCVFGVFAIFFVTFSNSFVLLNGIITALFFCIDYGVRNRDLPSIAYIPVGRAYYAESLPNINWIRLDEPILLESLSIQAVVVDLHSVDLDEKWQRFLAHIALKNIPVYHIRQVEESLTGRVKINHLYENDLGSLIPFSSYIVAKRIIDILLIVISLPFSLPCMLIIMILIKIENPYYSVFFKQRRIGQYGKEFTIYKFRSMTPESEFDGPQFAKINDMRITKVGNFIRKIRFDELPQLWNILKGEMSLVGPRPEQKEFVDKFEKTIPFYSYRHIVKPGLSGWAQVKYGYAADEDATRIKVEYDFFYIKFFSLSMDVLILLKTIQTVVMRKGSR